MASQLAQETFEAFEPFINVFDCGGSYFAGIYHLIPKEAWDLYRRHKQGERNLRFEDGDKFNVYQDIIRNIYSPLHVQKHMEEGELSYFTSGNQGLGLLYLDVDAHHNWQQDQYKAKAVLQKLFPFGYFRSSMRGQNGFLKVRYSSIHEFNKIADCLEKSLRSLFLHLGILCDIEVKGTITHKGRSGRLAKLPFATKPMSAKRDESDSWNIDQLQNFKSCPVVNARRVKHIVEKLALDPRKVQRTRELKERLLAEEKASQAENVQPGQKEPKPTKQSVVSSKPTGTNNPKPVDTVRVPTTPGRSDDAFVRNHEDIPPFIRAFFKKYRRFPTTEETLAWLKSNKLYSGDWEENVSKRTNRVQQILRFKEQTFDPDKLSGSQYKAVDLRLGRFADWVRGKFGSCLTANVVDIRGFDPVSMTAPITQVSIPARFVETFLVVADVCLKQDPLDNKAVPTNRFKALWKLVEGGAPWNQRHYQIVRDRLDRMGVVEIIDRKHEAGKAWRWEAGSYFPSFMSEEKLKRLKRSRQLVVIGRRKATLSNTLNNNTVHNTLYQTDARILDTRGWKQAVRPPP